jgi:hypothetical protein
MQRILAANSEVFMTKYRVEQTSARSWTDVQMKALFAEGFPEFIIGDKKVGKYIARVREAFQEYDLILTDENDQLAATGWGVPIMWSGVVTELPSSFVNQLRFTMDWVWRIPSSSVARWSIHHLRAAELQSH